MRCNRWASREQAIPWLIDGTLAFFAIVVAEVWSSTPVFAILILAGLLAMPREPIEAAKVDGCTPWQSFRYVTWPFIMPFAYIAMTIRSLDVGRAYDIVKIMTDGGPARRTELIWTLIGRTAYSDARMGVGERDGLRFDPAVDSLHRLFLPKARGRRGRRSRRTGEVALTRNQTSQLVRMGASVAHSAALFLAMLVICAPGAWIVLNSLRPTVEIMAKPPVWIPQRLSLDAYTSMFGGLGQGGVPVLDYFRNSLIVSIASTVIAIAVGMAGGYAFARYRFKGKSALFLGLMLTRTVPGIALSLPLFIIFARIGIIDTHLGADPDLRRPQRAFHDLAYRRILSSGASRSR